MGEHEHTSGAFLAMAWGLVLFERYLPAGVCIRRGAGHIRASTWAKEAHSGELP